MQYEDSIEFQSKVGSLRVCLHATVPQHSLEVPESVLLPTCAVEHSSNATFLLRNMRYDHNNYYYYYFFITSYQVNKLQVFSYCFCKHSKLQTFFRWECEAPFHLSPEKGLLKPRQNCCITVVFQPRTALVHQGRVHCWFGEESNEAKSSCTVLLQGEGTVVNNFQQNGRRLEYFGVVLQGCFFFCFFSNLTFYLLLRCH